MGRKNTFRNLWQKIRKLSQQNLNLKILLFLIFFLTIIGVTQLCLIVRANPDVTSGVVENFSTLPVLHQHRSKNKTFQRAGTRPAPILSSLNLKSLFSSDHFWTATLSAEKKITLITTGDVIPARSVNFQMTKRNNFTWPFEKTHQFLKSADLTLSNLEAPLIKNCPVTNTGMVFCGNQKFIEGLKLAGIDVANLANNHSLNWEIEGLCQTIELLENNQILTSGFPENIDCHNLSFWSPTESDKKQAERIPKQLTIKKIKGTRFGFLGFDFLTSFNQSDLLQSIKVAKQRVDILVISAHWGTEYTHLPNTFQKELAHRMMDEGADIIIGNHSHWIQSIEIYKGKPIIYAHGNFIFDQEWSQKTKLGMVAKFTFFDKKIVDIEFKPLRIQLYGQPYWLEGKEKEEILRLLEKISRNFAIQ